MSALHMLICGDHTQLLSPLFGGFSHLFLENISGLMRATIDALLPFFGGEVCFCMQDLERTFPQADRAGSRSAGSAPSGHRCAFCVVFACKAVSVECELKGFSTNSVIYGGEKLLRLLSVTPFADEDASEGNQTKAKYNNCISCESSAIAAILTPTPTHTHMWAMFSIQLLPFIFILLYSCNAFFAFLLKDHFRFYFFEHGAGPL